MKSIRNCEGSWRKVENSNVSQSKLVDVPFEFQVLQDSSKKSYTNGELKILPPISTVDSKKLRAILIKKPDLKDSFPMKDVGIRDDVVNVIGMVNDIKNTKNNHEIMEVEDETGSITVLIHNENHSTT